MAMWCFIYGLDEVCDAPPPKTDDDKITKLPHNHKIVLQIIEGLFQSGLCFLDAEIHFQASKVLSGEEWVSFGILSLS
jgi:hypothetical protein